MSELLAIGNLDYWNKISTGVFLTLFVWLFLWTYRPGAKADYERQATLPLGDEGPSDGE